MNFRSLVSTTVLGLALVSPALTPAMAADVQPSLDNRVSINAQDANLADILTILAEQSGYNIVTGSELSVEDENDYERITLRVDNTPVSEALDLVVRAAGLSYEKVGNSFIVATPEKIQQEVGLNSYVIPLHFASAPEIKEMIKDLTESAQVDPINNSIVLRTSTKIYEEVRSVVEAVDRPVPQVVLEAKLIEVVVSDDELIGIDWAKLNSVTTILAENGQVRQDWMIPEEWGTPTSDQGWKNNAGGPWLWMNELQVNRGVRPSTAPFQPLDLDNIGRFSRQMTAFDITMNFMLRNNKASILANSKVATLNNREAELAVADIVSYVSVAGGQSEQITVNEKEIGVKLYILPQINPDGWITTMVQPEVSSIVDWIGPHKDIPRIKSRRSKTTVRVKDGESIIIAGLLETDRQKNVDRIPLLSKMPFIGGLFRSYAETVNKTDLVIQITPHILTPEGDYQQVMPDLALEVEEELQIENLIQDNDK